MMNALHNRIRIQLTKISHSWSMLNKRIFDG